MPSVTASSLSAFVNRCLPTGHPFKAVTMDGQPVITYETNDIRAKMMRVPLLSHLTAGGYQVLQDEVGAIFIGPIRVQLPTPPRRGRPGRR